ncbi:MAG TPA: hypothetical protein VIM73_09905 [Polyangiaceae bacterium]
MALLAGITRQEATATKRSPESELLVELIEEAAPSLEPERTTREEATEPEVRSGTLDSSSNAPAPPNPPSSPAPDPGTPAALSSPSVEPSTTDGEAEVVASGAEPAPGQPRKIDLGLDGNLFLVPPGQGARSLTKDQKARAGSAEIQRRLTQSFVTADVERGLARGGALIGTLNAAVRATGPARGDAMFSVTVDSSGNVAAVELLRGESKDWSAVARAFREQVRKKQLRIPKGARGLRVTYAVQAKVQYPSGRTAAPPVQLKSPSLAPGGLIPEVGFDAGDIGAKAQRMVYARVVSEEVL